MGLEQEPQTQSPENNVDKLTRWRQELEEIQGIFESRIDELAKKLETAITSVQENSLKNRKQEELLSEVLESQMIMKEVYELREGIKRLEDLINKIDEATKKENKDI